MIERVKSRASWRLLLVVVAVALASTGCSSGPGIDEVVQPDTPTVERIGTPVPAVEPTAVVPEPVIDSIRQVDFAHGFTYRSGLGFGPDEVTVADGEYSNGEFGDEDYFWFGVTEVEYGDLDRDGQDEALVATTWNGGGSGFFDSVDAYRLVDGQPVLAGQLAFGDRADGGIYDVEMRGASASVWTFSTTLGACCPNQITENVLVLGDHSLVVAERRPTKAWLAIGPNGVSEDTEISFLPGTSSAITTMYDFDDNGAFTFEARQGQRITFDLLSGPAPLDISVLDPTTGQVLSGLASVTLPSDAVYEVEMAFDSDRQGTSTIAFSIDADRAPSPSVTWTTRIDQELVVDEPRLLSTLTWPEIAADQPGVDAANAALSAYVGALDDYWVDDLRDFPPGDVGNYDLHYAVTYAGDEIMSVRFDYLEYVCCRPYPNYGVRSAVVDLVAGRLLDLDEIIDTSRLPEINQMWLQAMQADGLLSDMVEHLIEQGATFDALTIVDGGVELSTDRNSLGGGTAGTATVLTFDQLGDLVQPALRVRL